MAKLKEIGIRLAIRREGEFINAYLAQRNTMDDATLLGSLAIGPAGKPDIFEAWKKLMTVVVSRAVTEAFGQQPTMVERAAPESERSGSS